MAPSSPQGFASAVLAAAGIYTLYGPSDSGLPVVECDEGLAGLLARAHSAVRNKPAAAISSDGTVEVVGRTGGPSDHLVVDSCGDSSELVARLRSALDRGGIVLRLEVDPSRPWPASMGPAASPDPWHEDHGPVTKRIQRARSHVVLVGPGVVSSGGVPGLHALATALSAGVLNTWGAKGIFHWRSRHHWATIGLQDQDFSLSGIEEAELVIATGVDVREAPNHCWQHRDHVVIDPAALAAIAEVVTPRGPVMELPPLRVRLAKLAQAERGSLAAPLPPSQATQNYAAHLANGGLIAADAGLAGFWVARTFATTELGSVAVPAEVDPGWAAACVVVARLGDPLRPALAVVNDQIDETTGNVLDYAHRQGIAVGVEVWSQAGEALGREQHERQLHDKIAPGGEGSVTTLATDAAQLEEFIAAAGELRSWEPRAPSGVCTS